MDNLTYQYLNILKLKTTAAKRIFIINVDNGKCDNMRNTNKTVINIPYSKGWSIFVFISYPLPFKNFTDLQQILEIIKNLALAKKPKC